MKVTSLILSIALFSVETVQGRILGAYATKAPKAATKAPKSAKSGSKPSPPTDGGGPPGTPSTPSPPGAPTAAPTDPPTQPPTLPPTAPPTSCQAADCCPLVNIGSRATGIFGTPPTTGTRQGCNQGAITPLFAHNTVTYLIAPAFNTQAAGCYTGVFRNVNCGNNFYYALDRGVNAYRATSTNSIPAGQTRTLDFTFSGAGGRRPELELQVDPSQGGCTVQFALYNVDTQQCVPPL